MRRQMLLAVLRSRFLILFAVRRTAGVLAGRNDGVVDEMWQRPIEDFG